MKIHVKIQDKTYEVRMGDVNTRPIQVEVDGEMFEVWPQEMIVPTPEGRPSPGTSVTHPVRPVESAGSPKKPAVLPTKVLAPIPGVVIEIKISAGDTVRYGQELCVLEAMKMKNAIRSNRDGIIESIHISEGAQVQQSQILISFRDDGQK